MASGNTKPKAAILVGGPADGWNISIHPRLVGQLKATSPEWAPVQCYLRSPSPDDFDFVPVALYRETNDGVHWVFERME